MNKVQIQPTTNNNFLPYQKGEIYACSIACNIIFIEYITIIYNITMIFILSQIRYNILIPERLQYGYIV